MGSRETAPTLNSHPLPPPAGIFCFSDGIVCRNLHIRKDFRVRRYHKFGKNSQKAWVSHQVKNGENKNVL